MTDSYTAAAPAVIVDLPPEQASHTPQKDLSLTSPF